MVAHFTRFNECGYVTADARPPEALCDAAQRCFIAVVRRLVQRAKHFYGKRGGHDNAGRDNALVAMLKERVFDCKLGPHDS